MRYFYWHISWILEGWERKTGLFDETNPCCLFVGTRWIFFKLTSHTLQEFIRDLFGAFAHFESSKSIKIRFPQTAGRLIRKMPGAALKSVWVSVDYKSPEKLKLANITAKDVLEVLRIQDACAWKDSDGDWAKIHDSTELLAGDLEGTGDKKYPFMVKRTSCKGRSPS